MKRFLALLVLVVFAVCLSGPGSARADDALDALKAEKEKQQLELDLLNIKKQRDNLAALAEKEQAEAIQAVAAAKLARQKSTAAQDLAEYSTLKELLGDPKPRGQGGAVVPTEKAVPLLFWTRAGGAAQLDKVAGDMCRDLASKTSQPVLILPKDFATQRKAVALFDASVDAYKKQSEAMAKDLMPKPAPVLGTKSRITPNVFAPGFGELAAAATVGMFLLNTASDFSKAFQTDRSLSIPAQEPKDSLFHSLVYAQDACAKVVMRIDLEMMQAGSTGAELDQMRKDIDTLWRSYSDWEQLKAAEEAKVQAAQFLLDKANDAGRGQATQNLVNAKAGLGKVMRYAPFTTALKAFLDQVTTEKLAAIATVRRMEKMLEGKPGLSLTLGTQDVQINAESAWSKSLRRQNAVELQYQLVNLDGTVAASGFISSRAAEGKIDWEKAETFHAKSKP